MGGGDHRLESTAPGTTQSCDVRKITCLNLNHDELFVFLVSEEEIQHNCCPPVLLSRSEEAPYAKTLIVCLHKGFVFLTEKKIYIRGSTFHLLLFGVGDIMRRGMPSSRIMNTTNTTQPSE